MTDERRESDRRAEDKMLRDELREMLGSLKDGSFILPDGRSANEVVGAHDEGIGKLEEQTTEIVENQNTFLDLMLGKEQKTLDGRLKRAGNGYISRIEELHTQSHNGGVPARLKPGEKVAVYAAGIGGIATIVAAIILATG